MADNTPMLGQATPVDSPTYSALNIGAGTITGSQIGDDTITGTNIDDLDLSGKDTLLDTGTVGGWTLNASGLIGPSGAFIRVGQTDYDDGIGFWLGNDGGTPKFSIGDSDGNKLIFDGTDLSLTGTITATDGSIGGWTIGAADLVGPTGAIIRSGQTDFNVGTGFWLGNVAGTPKFSIGSQSGNQMYWNGTDLIVTGNFTASSVIQTYSYLTANLPLPPTSAGFNNPSANE